MSLSQLEQAHFHNIMRSNPRRRARRNPGFLSNLTGLLGGAEPTLTMGSTHPSVKKAQKLLTKAGFVTPETGTFDFITKNNVMAFQMQQGLPASGGIDQPTWAALKAPGQARTEQAVTAGGQILTDLIGMFGRPQNEQQLMDPSLTAGGGASTESSVKWGQWALIGGSVFVVGAVGFMAWRTLSKD